jgi:PTS system ascorbate-specific IIB component
MMGDTIRIIAVCSAGLGTSILAKITIENVAKKLGYNVFVEAVDVGSVTGVDGDAYLTTKDLAKVFTVPEGKDLIVVTNLIDEDEMEKVIAPHLKKLAKKKSQ